MNAYDAKYEQDVVSYFRNKAEDYDKVDDQVYWRLSDRLLDAVLRAKILSALPAEFRFLDAGGGTGRWTERLLEHAPKSRGILFDLCVEMSAKARERALRRAFTERLSVVNGRLEDAARVLGDQRFELVFNFHNVLGFVQDALGVVAQLANLLAPGGLLVSFVPNLYHAIFFNILVGHIDEAAIARQMGRGRFTKDMPYMNLFTPKGMGELCAQNGLDVIVSTGFPTLIYPGMKETQLFGSTQSIDGILSDPDLFERVFELERWALEQPDIAARGNNLFVVGKKR
jgi:SAM-dependent methyltransferase